MQHFKKCGRSIPRDIERSKNHWVFLKKPVTERYVQYHKALCIYRHINMHIQKESWIQNTFLPDLTGMGSRRRPRVRVVAKKELQFHVTSIFYFLFFIFRFYLFIFREREREGDRGGEKHRCARDISISCLLHAPLGDLSRNPGMCPDRESNQWLFQFTGQHSIHWATPARVLPFFKRMYSCIGF